MVGCPAPDMVNRYEGKEGRESGGGGRDLTGAVESLQGNISISESAAYWI